MRPEQWLLLSYGVGGLLVAFGLGTVVGAWLMKRHAEAMLARAERACRRLHETAHPACDACAEQMAEPFEDAGYRIRREFD
jgi:hypothetical protein